ncbi:MAG TPA: ParB/RepB/Spo0J family partition protein [Ktedonobacteraceae bacterium]|jgi:hypothetical protein
MTTAVTVETVQLEEIRDLDWPTDRELVASFRKTLQYGGQFALIQVNRLWQEDATWHYEVIDGFHRYEAAKTEQLESLLCQVIEVDERTARYARIQACLGKPSAVTGARALLELRHAFVADMQVLIGNPDVLFEPVLGEDGQVQARRRSASLPEDPYQALEVLTDHLLATRAAYPKYIVRDVWQRSILRTPFGRRTGWEQALNEWMAELGERFGHSASWLLNALHMQLFDDFLGPREWYDRRGQPPFTYKKEYLEFALRLWKIPDIDLRAWFRHQLDLHPQDRHWLAKVQDLLELNSFPEPGQIRTGPNKQEILNLLAQYPSLYSLAVTLRKRQQGAPTETSEHPVQEIATPDQMPQQAPGGGKFSEPPVERESPIFAVVSSHFPKGPLPPAVPLANIVPSSGSISDHALAYQPVHEACQALLRAIEYLTAQYGRDWLEWESAQEDLAKLRNALALD